MNQDLTLRIERIWQIAKTDFVQRYYGSVLGLLWAFLNPMFRITVYYFAFSYLIFRNREPQFILYLFTGITIWSLFSEGTNKGMKLLRSKKYLITSLKINKLDIYLASFLSISFSFFLNLAVYMIFTLFFDVQFSWYLIYFPVIFISLAFTVIGVGMIISVFHIFLKDLDHLWSIVIMAGFWTVPIIWSQDFIYQYYPWMIYTNPITGVLVNTRNILLYNLAPDYGALIFDFVLGALLFIVGIAMIKYKSHKAVETL